MSIHNRVNEVYPFQLAKALIEAKCTNTDDLVGFLLGEDSDYVVYHRNDVYKKSSLKQRLHLLWLTPCWFVCVPFLWLFTGETGVSQHGKLGKWIAKVTGI